MSVQSCAPRSRRNSRSSSAKGIEAAPMKTRAFGFLCRRAGGAAGLLAAALLACAAYPAGAATPAEFYKGRTMFVIVGYTPGGGYDLYARVLAQHLGKHIPGNPTVIPQNMPGAGSLKAANYLYSVAPK